MQARLHQSAGEHRRWGLSNVHVFFSTLRKSRSGWGKLSQGKILRLAIFFCSVQYTKKMLLFWKPNKVRYSQSSYRIQVLAGQACGATRLIETVFALLAVLINDALLRERRRGEMNEDKNKHALQNLFSYLLLRWNHSRLFKEYFCIFPFNLNVPPLYRTDDNHGQSFWCLAL